MIITIQPSGDGFKLATNTGVEVDRVSAVTATVLARGMICIEAMKLEDAQRESHGNQKN